MSFIDDHRAEYGVEPITNVLPIAPSTYYAYKACEVFQMQAWVTRTDPSNPDSGTLNADQAISLEQAVYGYTRGGIECLGFDWPDKLGSIEAGKLADFIVLDRDIFEIPIEEVKDTNVDLTVVGGEVVFDRGN